jgi:hypothetical protein
MAAWLARPTFHSIRWPLFLERAFAPFHHEAASAYREVVTESLTSIESITDMLCNERSTFC